MGEGEESPRASRSGRPLRARFFPPLFSINRASQTIRAAFAVARNGMDSIATASCCCCCCVMEGKDVCGETGQKVAARVTERWRRTRRRGDFVSQVYLRAKKTCLWARSRVGQSGTPSSWEAASWRKRTVVLSVLFESSEKPFLCPGALEQSRTTKEAVRRSLVDGLGQI